MRAISAAALVQSVVPSMTVCIFADFVRIVRSHTPTSAGVPLVPRSISALPFDSAEQVAML